MAAGEGQRIFPWGNQSPNSKIANFNKRLFGNSLAGNSHPIGVTPEGVFHMGGNVSEHTISTNNSGSRVRGGSYYDSVNILKNDSKIIMEKANYSSRFIGFRCVK